MAFAYSAFLVFLLVQGETFGAIVRKPPAFATPIYSNSYLPASMQVIFHAVEQLKALEEMSQNSSSVSSTAILDRKDSERPTSPSIVTTETSLPDTTSHKPNEGDDSDEPIMNETTEYIQSIDQTTLLLVSTSSSPITSPNHESSQGTSLTSEQQIQSTTSEGVQGSDSILHHQQQEQHEEPSEINEETPEMNYATPEINHEVPEIVHVTQQSLLDDKTSSMISVNTSTTETNLAETSIKDESDESSIKPSPIEENPKEAGDGKHNVTRNFRIKIPKTRNGSNGGRGRSMDVSKEDSNKKKLTLGRRGNEDASKKKPTVDSIVNEIYDIVKPTITSSSPSSPIDDSDVTLKDTTDKLEVLEEEAEELRFTLLGEKVAQVPRPSLTSYLRIAKVPPKESLTRLADLYDALSKDARKQGFGKYAGYSDEVLKILETSAEGSAAKQLKTLLEKIMERNELTRDEARSKITEVLAKLGDPSSDLNRDLESLKPLKYII